MATIEMLEYWMFLAEEADSLLLNEQVNPCGRKLMIIAEAASRFDEKDIFAAVAEAVYALLDKRIGVVNLKILALVRILDYEINFRPLVGA